MRAAASRRIRLGRALAGLMPDEPEVLALRALMLLHDAREAARLRDGRVVPLNVQAAIGDLHLHQPPGWRQIAALYETLARQTSTPSFRASGWPNWPMSATAPQDAWWVSFCAADARDADRLLRAARRPGRGQ